MTYMDGYIHEGVQMHVCLWRGGCISRCRLPCVCVCVQGLHAYSMCACAAGASVTCLCLSCAAGRNGLGQWELHSAEGQSSGVFTAGKVGVWNLGEAGLRPPSQVTCSQGGERLWEVQREGGTEAKGQGGDLGWETL